MAELILNPIGVVRADESGFRLELPSENRSALTGLDGYSHVQVVWWFSKCDTLPCRAVRLETKPYTKGPDVLGTFATRSPERPNPIALSCSELLYVDRENGVVGLAYLDAEDGTPVLDLKPYVPSLDRVERPSVPGWCAHWPQCVEQSGDFDWEAEFSFKLGR